MDELVEENNPLELENMESTMKDIDSKNYKILQNEANQTYQPNQQLENQSRSLETSTLQSHVSPLIKEKSKYTPVQNELMEVKEEEAGKNLNSQFNEESSLLQQQIKRSQQLHRTKAVDKIRPLLQKFQILSKKQSSQRKLQQIMEGWGFSLLIPLAIIYAVFGDDIRILCVNKDGDQVFFEFTKICIGCFTLEIVLNYLANPNYLFNFYFWIDLMSVLTMILDTGLVTAHWDGDVGDVKDFATLKVLEKAARTTGKVAKIIRVIKIVRLIKLYKYSRLQFEKWKQKTVDRYLNWYGVSKQSDESKVSQIECQLQDQIMKRVITIIIASLISIPILSLDTYTDMISSYNSGIFKISQFREQYKLTDLLVQQYVEFHNQKFCPIQSVLVLQEDVNQRYIEYNYTTNPDWFQQTKMLKNEYRFTEQQYYVATDFSNRVITYSISNCVDYNKINALLSIFQTIFVCIVLALSFVLLNQDISQIILDPIQRMILSMKLIVEDPFQSRNFAEQEDLIMEDLLYYKDKKQLRKQQIRQQSETYFIEKLTMKIGVLIINSFGEEGTNMIAKNQRISGSVDPMVPGQKVLAIFGCCNIRNFTDVTEVLQKDVIVYFNQIAEIIHYLVDQFGGFSNQNVGDSFLLVWKYPNSKYYNDPETNQLVLQNSNSVRQFGDLAVSSIMQIIIKVSLSQKLAQYKSHQELNARIKDYQVQMEFGLDFGWGIEGLVGSSFKIDPSYLSQSISVASKLAAANKLYGTDMLIGGSLKKNLTQNYQDKLRQVDVVIVKGNIEPLELYTLDLSIKALQRKIYTLSDVYNISGLNIKEKKKYLIINQIRKQELLRQVECDRVRVTDFFNENYEIIAARSPYTNEFYDVWSSGFKCYIRGEWDEAYRIFLQTLAMIPQHKDGPSQALLEFIDSNQGTIPKNWNGFRELPQN